MFIFAERSLGAVLAALAVALLVGVAGPSISSSAAARSSEAATSGPGYRFAGMPPRILALTLWRS